MPVNEPFLSFSDFSKTDHDLLMETIGWVELKREIQECTGPGRGFLLLISHPTLGRVGAVILQP